MREYSMDNSKFNTDTVIHDAILSNAVLYVQILENYLARLQIQTRLIRAEDPLPADQDLGLRSRILQAPKPASVLDFHGIDPDFRIKHNLYDVEDRFGCHYFILPLPEKQDAVRHSFDTILIGPFLVRRVDFPAIQAMQRRLKLPGELTTFLLQYYAALPCYENDDFLVQFLLSIADAVYGVNQYSFSRLREIPENQYAYRHDMSEDATELTRASIEKRYEAEERMMNAIARGDLDAALEISASSLFSSLDIRSSSALRSQKNYMVILNVLARKGAQRGGVHPVYLDDTSRKLAYRIENAISMQELGTIRRDIFRRYCSLVRTSQTKGYSPIIQKVVSYLIAHLDDAGLTLQSTAEHFGLNKSYLAATFRREVGVTFTHYVNSRRIDQAIGLLNVGAGSITSIASAVGIPDITYFARVFKAQKGMSPSAYQKMIYH